jgi:uncharacterized surface protein with fasciclin (FAS1) repeats
MKTTFQILISAIILAFLACNSQTQEKTSDSSQANIPGTGQSGVKDETSKPNIVQVASGSKDHTTLVTAVKAADLVDALSNAGPFTVFAPTNAAFEKLGSAAIENLLKPENKDALTDILQYHVAVGVYNETDFTDGQTIGEVNGGNIHITLVDGKPVINGKAHIIASVKASNGVIHILDEVLTPDK